MDEPFFNSVFVGGHLGHCSFKAINHEIKHPVHVPLGDISCCGDLLLLHTVAGQGVEMTKAHGLPLHCSQLIVL